MFSRVSHGPQRMQIPVLEAGHCSLLVWEFEDGDWCHLHQLWHWQWRHKVGAKLALWWADLG